MHHTTWPTASGAIIGYRQNGAPIRLQAGGSEGTLEATPPPAPAAAPPAAPAAPAPPAQQAPPAPAAPVQPPAPAPQPPAAAQPPAAPQQAPAQAPADSTDWKAQAEAAQAAAAAAKAEADRWKAQSRQQEARSKANHAELKNRDALLREIAAKVGVEFDDKPDPEVLTQRLAEAQQAARQRTVELAVYTTAAEAGAAASALLDSREFMARTAALDPEAADFPSQVADLVREAAKQPKYQFQQPPAAQAQPPAAPAEQAPAQQQPPAPQPPAPSSGADFSGAPGHGKRWTQAEYSAYMATAHIHDRDGSKLTEAIKRGELIDLGIGQPRGRGRR
jgi:hypothetical protein